MERGQFLCNPYIVPYRTSFSSGVRTLPAHLHRNASWRSLLGASLRSKSSDGQYLFRPKSGPARTDDLLDRSLTGQGPRRSRDRNRALAVRARVSLRERDRHSGQCALPWAVYAAAHRTRGAADQNFTVTVPVHFNVSEVSLNVAHFSLIGVNIWPRSTDCAAWIDELFSML